MFGRKSTALYWAWISALTALFYAVPSWHLVTWGALGITSATAVTAGTLTYRPRRKAPWLALSVALLAFCAGDTTYNILTSELGQDGVPYPSLADGFYLGMVPLLLGGLIALARSGVRGRDRASLLDALTLTLGVGLLSWIFLIAPYVRDEDLSTVERLTSIAYPLADILILLTLARLVAGGRRGMALGMLSLGSIGLIIADVLYGFNQLGGNWQVGGPTDLGWIVFYAAFGAAAIHPSMVHLTVPKVVKHHGIASSRLVLLSLASLIAPLVLLVEAWQGAVRDALIIAIVCVVMFMLVLLRLAGVVSTHGQALARERALRRAGAALVAASDNDQVRQAVRTAVADLLPAGVEHRIVIAMAGGVGPTDEIEAPASTDKGARLVPVRQLTGRAVTELADFEIALYCTLGPDRSAHSRAPAALVVAGDEMSLVALEDAVEVLGTQAALAAERIGLSHEVNKRIGEEYFRTLVHHSTDVVLILDEDDLIRYASPAAAIMFGRTELVGDPLPELIDPHGRAMVLATLNEVRHARATEFIDWAVLRPDGTQVQAEAYCRDLRADPTVNGVVVTLRDVTERRRLESELTHQALHDALTGLANRVLFNDRTARAVERSVRDSTLTGVLFIDLDDFKVINDTKGHETGDELLAGVGERLRRLVARDDTVARLGGDEFAILIEGAGQPADIESIAGRIIAAMAEPLDIRGELLTPNMSIGVAVSTDASDPTDLLRQADLALYVAKGSGKNQFRRYQSSLHTALLQRLELRAALEKSVTEGGFLLHYQPIVDMKTGVMRGAEALLRWDRPGYGFVPPNQFIDVAEDSGLIVPIGNWVLRKALATAAEWYRTGRPDPIPYVSVNVSARQFRTPGFVELVREQLEANALPPYLLVLEITESLLLRDAEQVWIDLTALREIGVRIAIDDFGTGYSSLSYLRQVPADILKIDKSFVDDIATQPQQAAVVQAIVSLAHTLNLQVVAEGIEDEASHELLTRFGCALGQGYLFARPVSAAQLLQAAAKTELLV